MDNQLFPKVKKGIQNYLSDQEGNVPRSKILTVGSVLLVLGVVFSTEAFAKHSSHSSHGSHSSHSSHSSGHSNGHVSHESHESHASHASGDHSSHSSGAHSSHSSGAHSSGGSYSLPYDDTSTTTSIAPIGGGFIPDIEIPNLSWKWLLMWLKIIIAVLRFLGF